MSAKSLAGRIERVAGEAAPQMLAAYEDGSVFERFNAFMTDKAFTSPASACWRRRGRMRRSIAYRFDWRSRLLGGIMGSCHAFELGFVFGSYRERMCGSLLRQGA